MTDNRYAVDVRLFLATITVAMFASFLAGVGLNDASMPSIANSAADHFMVRDSFPALMNEGAEQEVEQHKPAGQHLLVDMAGVDGDFLDSEERLSKAMVGTVKEAGLSMLSYHCHSLKPKGVSCVGVLLESHISFHTWPDEGVITLDLFTCGSNPLLPVVEVIENLFGIAGPGKELKTRWSHELRGFRSPDENHYLDDSSDLALWVLSPLELYYKKQIYSNTTTFQRVDIWDTVEASKKKEKQSNTGREFRNHHCLTPIVFSMCFCLRQINETPSWSDVQKYNLTPDDPRLSTPELVTPDRFLFLDGILQSMLSSENVYHETMVHPAMFAHPSPKHVAILGGGEGATLREVLKHKTIESVVQIEIDKELVQIVRQYMPTMSDCSDLQGRAQNCFDDNLVTMVYEDGTKWFVERQKLVEEGKVPKFDVLLIDALDPDDKVNIADQLYSNKDVINSFVESLSDDGIMAIQIGTAATIHDPKPDVGINARRERMFNYFEDHPDVEAMLVFEEPNCLFLEPHSFMIVCKSAECRSRWYARSDQVEYEIYDRIVKTHSKKRALTYYDGTTQRSYQWPKKGWETVYCRREPTPFECAYRHLDPKAERHEFVLPGEEAVMGESSFRIESKQNEAGETIETHVYATKNIPKGSFIMPQALAASLMLTERNLEGLHSNVQTGGGKVTVIEDLLEFFSDFGHESGMDGSKQSYVEVGASVLIRRVADKAETNVERWVPDHPSGNRPKYSPVYERRRVGFDVFLVASSDIKQGEELVMYEKLWTN